jgi:hypothetical protein
VSSEKGKSQRLSWSGTEGERKGNYLQVKHFSNVDAGAYLVFPIDLTSHDLSTPLHFSPHCVNFSKQSFALFLTAQLSKQLFSGYDHECHRYMSLRAHQPRLFLNHNRILVDNLCRFMDFGTSQRTGSYRNGNQELY